MCLNFLQCVFNVMTKLNFYEQNQQNVCFVYITNIQQTTNKQQTIIKLQNSIIVIINRITAGSRM